MGRIQVLPDSLCNQIAAGEVVERPAAVVKELTENSIDAGSRKIHVALRDGGRKEIRVVDNGCGMSHDDALLSIERHATSKIKDVHDLQAIRSMGFRGEALPSIASVSRFELVTREADSLSGTLVRVEGGILRDVRETGSPVGTLITVRDLFYNMPARRKFLRTVDTEMAHIADQFLRLALAHPHIHFQLLHQERSIYDFPPAKTPLARVSHVLGSDFSAKLCPFSLEADAIVVRGFVAPPDVQRPNAQSLFLYANKRPVWDRMLNRAILNAYESVIPKGKYPLVVLFLEIPPDLLDVNVHPTKREVRFRNPSDIMERVREAILRSLARYRPCSEPRSAQAPAWAREEQQPATPPFPRGVQVSFDSRPTGGAAVGIRPIPDPGAFPVRSALEGTESTLEGISPESVPVPTPPQAATGFSRLPVLGQVGNVYILLEAPDGLILIDQHAAHERILYDQFASRKEGIAQQRLLRSVVLQLLPKEAATLRQWIPRLTQLGFDLESFGGQSFIVSAVPALLNDIPPDALIRDLLSAAHEEERNPNWNIAADLVKSAACHKAVRAGQRLKPEELQRLLADLDATVLPSTCPHGRPLWVKLTHADIARLFHRT